MNKCAICGRKVPRDRGNQYCSLACERVPEAKQRATLKERIEATTAWRPIELDPVEEVVSGYPVAVFSDIHAPIHSKYWIERGITAAEKFGAKTLIVNGDFIDANTISRHLGGYYRRKSELDDDLAAGEALTKLFSETFEKVYFLSGNHCLQRLTQVFKGEVSAKRLWNLFGTHHNVKLTSRSFLHVNKDVIVGHPRQYSSVRGNLTQKMAQLKQKHVVTGHHHHSAKTATADGKWQAVEVACMADIEAFEYVKNELNTFAEPMNGFAMIFGTKIELFDKFTNWELFGL